MSVTLTPNTLTPKQKANWNIVLSYMEINPNIRYDHRRFCTVLTSTTLGVDVLSAIFLSGFYKAYRGISFNDVKENYPALKDFGDGSFNEVFNTETPFGIIIKQYPNLTFATIVPYLRKFLNLPVDNDCQVKVTFNTIPHILHFPNQEFAKEFMQWNPECKANIKQAVTISKVQKTLLFDVEKTLYL